MAEGAEADLLLGDAPNLRRAAGTSTADLSTPLLTSLAAVQFSLLARLRVGRKVDVTTGTQKELSVSGRGGDARLLVRVQ